MITLQKLKLLILVLICSTCLIPHLVVFVQAAPLTWFVETVDAANFVGSYSSLALDSNDNPHISYRDSNWSDLKYAKWTGSAWTIAPVDTVGNVGQWSSLALDSNDNPHISYFDNDNYDLKYTTFSVVGNISVQITTSIDTIGAVGAYSSIAIDSLDRPHISYTDFTNDTLKYARWTGVAWEIETVENPHTYVGDTSLALDSNDRPHISYSEDELRYARWTGASWSIETVEDVQNTYTSIALDSNDNPHISYNDYTNRNLKYAVWNGTAWFIETVDASLNVGEFCSIALDSANYPHISYYDAYWQDLKYAVWNGTAWFIKNVDSVGDVGNWETSIALDSNDNPHISYLDYTNRNLKYARDPDEYFYEVGYAAFDSNGDSFNDGMEVWIDVDTTYFGSINISVQGFLTDELGLVYSLNVSRWNIIGASVEYGYVHLYLPDGAPEGWYNIGLALYDERYTIEDGQLIDSAAYLYPPNMRKLTIQVEGFGTTSPVPGEWWAAQGTELNVTAIPDAEYVLGYWLLDSINIGTENPTTISMDVDHVLIAVFSEMPLGWLEGEVTDVETDNPIIEANITGTSNQGAAFFVVTNTTGHYRIMLDPGTYNVTAEKPGYINSTVTYVHIISEVVTTLDFDLLSYSPPLQAKIESCNSIGEQQDVFELGETVYVNGSGFSPFTGYPFYIVTDQEIWVDGMTIPERVPSTEPSILSNADGDIEPTDMWHDPQAVGNFDMIVDVNGNGQYDVGVDVLDDSDVELVAGFSVIPELSTMLPIFFLITSIPAILLRKKIR